MPDVKFSEFAAGGDLEVGDIIVGLRSGINTKFNTPVDVLTGNTVFVATSGSNVTGTGSFNEPFATVAHAMTTITTATYSNPFTIIVMGGKITETAQILLKPNVGIAGLGQQTFVVLSAPIILDSSYLSAITAQSSFTNITINGDIDLDFSSASVVASHVIIIANAAVGSVSLNANIDVLSTLTIDSVGMGNVTVNNCILLLYSTTLNNFTGGNLTSNKQLSTIVVGNSFSGTLDLHSTAVFDCLYFFRGNYIQNLGSVTLTNNRSFWYVDSSTYQTPTIINGGNIRLDSVSAGVFAGYTPTHYTPVATAPN